MNRWKEADVKPEVLYSVLGKNGYTSVITLREKEVMLGKSLFSDLTRKIFLWKVWIRSRLEVDETDP